MTARVPAVLFASLLAAACTADEPAPADMTVTDEAAIDQVRADYVDHYNQHHAAVVADLFTDSAFFLMADGYVAMHKPAILAELEGDMEGSPTLAIQSLETRIFGDDAVGRGTYNVTVAPPGAAAMTLAGHYMTHFRKVGGAWKINGLITNFDAPPPEGFTMREPEGEPPPDGGTMGQLAAAFTSAFNAGNWAAVAQQYTPDAVAAFSESPRVEGNSAIQNRFAERFGSATARTIEIHDVATLEFPPGWALDGGWYMINMTVPEGRTMVGGTYMNLLQQQSDGSWKIHWGVSNGHAEPATM